MQVTIKDKQPVEATVEVIIPAAEVDAAFDSVLKEVSANARIPGFRPGKVPLKVLENRIGTEALQQEVRQKVIDATVSEALEEAGLKPVSLHYHGDQPVRGQDFAYDIHMDLVEDFELPDISGIVIDTAQQPVTDEDVAQAVENLRMQNATMIPVDRPAVETDSLLVETLDENGESGGSMPFELSRATDNLRAQFIGRSAGDEFEITLEVPPAAEDDAEAEDAEAAEDESENLEGSADSTSTLKVRVTDVRERELPGEDDDFASTLGFDNWQALLDYVRTTLETQRAEETFEEQKEEFASKLLAEAEFDVPAGMLNQRQQFLLQQLESDLARRGGSLERYISTLEEKNEMEAFQEDLKNKAREAVRRDLMVERLMNERQTVLSDEEFTRELQELATSEGLTVPALLDRQGDSWAGNYRFMLRREKALEEAVRENLAAAAVAALE